jgi:hypothetical protein
MYAIIYALYDAWFRYEKNEYVFDDKIKFYAESAKEFIKEIGDLK